MLIRMEDSNDYIKVYEVVQRAFTRAEQSDGNEQHLVAALRSSEAFVPRLSLVAEEDGEIVGHILFTKVRIGYSVELALAPLSVIPGRQRQGIGLALIEAGHKVAREMGFKYVVVLGDDQYYPKAGYFPASRFGIRAPFEVPEKYYMAINLLGQNTPLHGVVEYAKEFGI